MTKNQTSFKPGHVPHNKNPQIFYIGVNAYRKDGCSICGGLVSNVTYNRKKDEAKCLSCYRGRGWKYKPDERHLDANGVVLIGGGARPKYEHRVIAEKALGRSLKSHEIVHHINMDKTDNRNCNLLVCDDKYHKWLHHQYQLRFAREKFS